MRFAFARSPHLEFGPGAISILPRLLMERTGKGEQGFDTVALVTGGESFRKSERRNDVLRGIRATDADTIEFSCGGEPSPEFVDAAVQEIIRHQANSKRFAVDRIAVLGIGGGSAMDAGKAIAAMVIPSAAALRRGEAAPSVLDFLEGVGCKTPSGDSVFFVAAPTTAGTGSEATKNAVISRVGQGGFKKSLRHDAYVPAVAIVDPEFALACPRSVSASSGLDAFTQLLEAYVSPIASPMVEAICESGISSFANAYARMLDDPLDVDARSGMAYAAYLSGICLANAGLGSVHALASPLGARFPVPHGVACGLLLVPAAALNIDLLRDSARGDGRTDPVAARRTLAKYARAGRLLDGLSTADHEGAESKLGAQHRGGEDRGAEERLLDRLGRLVERAAMPSLASFGMDKDAAAILAAEASTKTNPVPLHAEEYAALLASVI